MKTELIYCSAVLPSADIDRDVSWYVSKIGFELVSKDKMYAVLKRDTIFIHLQWHADTEEDPLHGGSVLKIFVKNIQPIFNEFVQQGVIHKDKLVLNTPWGTNEFGFYDLNANAIFFVASI